MDNDKYDIYLRLTILTGKYGYRVDGPQDSAYVANDKSYDPESRQVPVL